MKTKDLDRRCEELRSRILAEQTAVNQRKNAYSVDAFWGWMKDGPSGAADVASSTADEMARRFRGDERWDLMCESVFPAVIVAFYPNLGREYALSLIYNAGRRHLVLSEAKQ